MIEYHKSSDTCSAVTSGGHDVTPMTFLGDHLRPLERKQKPELFVQTFPRMEKSHSCSHGVKF